MIFRRKEEFRRNKLSSKSDLISHAGKPSACSSKPKEN